MMQVEGIGPDPWDPWWAHAVVVLIGVVVGLHAYMRERRQRRDHEKIDES